MPFTVGYRVGRATDPERPAWRSNSFRPLIWAAWYPAASGEIASQKCIGAPGEEIFRLGRVAEDAEVHSGQLKWPIVLMSHGTGGAAQGLTWLGSHLASKGFIAIGVSHHGNTADEPYLPEGFLCWWERARDLTVALDQLAVTGPLSDRLDLSNTFAAGFSLGGYTVLSLAGAITNIDLFDQWLAEQGGNASGPREFPDLGAHVPRLYEDSETFRQSMKRHSVSYVDERVKAVMAFAPAPPVRAFEPASLSKLRVPSKIIVGRNDCEAPHDACALWLQGHNASFDVYLLGQDVGHYAFLPEATDLGKARMPSIYVDPVGVERRAVHRCAAEATEAFFAASVA